MRKTFVLLGLLALALPLAGVAGVSAGEGTLSVEDGQGKVTLQARGGVIGRLDRGYVTIYDLTPEDAYDPYVFGDDQPLRFVGETGIRYGGVGLRFRLVGGRYRIVIEGRGIDLSVVAKGSGTIVGALALDRSRRVLARRRRLPNRHRELQAAPRASQAFPARRQRAWREGPRPLRRRVMTAGAQTILVVEDEASIASFVSLYLKNAGYDVRAVTTGSAALTHVADEAPALIILDLMLPDIDGIEICRRVRKTSDVPILMLTARDEDVDKIIGLEVGADDYLTKPFNPRELVARVKSVLRRAAPERRRDVEEELHHGDLSINAGRREVKVGEEEIQLAPKEFDLLWELLDHKGLVLTRDQLLERVWGYTFAGDTRTVDVHVRQLRRKLGEASPIVTVWGVGYKVGPDRAPAPAA